MKKIISLILCAVFFACLFSGCGAAEAKADYTVAIVQQLDHASLDEIRAAIVAEMEAQAKAQGITLDIQTFNGQNDGSVLNQIGTQVVSDNVDMIIPIATGAAQSMVTAAEGTEIPIIYSAVSDPAGAGLTDLPTVTGVSDALNTAFIMDMILALQPDVKTVGLLYSNSEINSATPIADAKAYLDAKGIAYLEKTGSNSGEILTAVSDMVGRVDAVFTPTDNTVMAVEAAVAEVLNEAGIPHYTGADSFVAAGAFATCGVNYTELGARTGEIAMSVLLGGPIGNFQVMDGGIITYNTEVARQLQLDAEIFKTMANTVIGVETTGE